MVRAKERGKWNAVGWLTKRTLAAAFCLCFPGRTISVAQETSWQHQLDDGQKLREQGRYTEAEEVYSAVLVAAEEFGPEDRRLALTLNKLDSSVKPNRSTGGRWPFGKNFPSEWS